MKDYSKVYVYEIIIYKGLISSVVLLYFICVKCQYSLLTTVVLLLCKYNGRL